LSESEEAVYSIFEFCGGQKRLGICVVEATGASRFHRAEKVQICGASRYFQEHRKHQGISSFNA